jgi:hypothetical protein
MVVDSGSTELPLPAEHCALHGASDLGSESWEKNFFAGEFKKKKLAAKNCLISSKVCWPLNGELSLRNGPKVFVYVL